jgi:hypothetical protein
MLTTFSMRLIGLSKLVLYILPINVMLNNATLGLLNYLLTCL